MGIAFVMKFLVATLVVLYAVIPTRRLNFQPVESVGSSCTTTNYENDGVTASSAWGATARQLWGQSRFTPASNAVVCWVEFKLTGFANNTTNTFTAQIWNHAASPNYNLNAKLAESAGVTGANWSSNWVRFTFSSPYTITNGIPYALVVGPAAALEANILVGYSDNTALSGYKDQFSVAGAAQDAGGNDTAIRIGYQ